MQGEHTLQSVLQRFHLLPQRKLQQHLRRMQRRRQQMSLQLQLPPPLRQSSLRPAP